MAGRGVELLEFSLINKDDKYVIYYSGKNRGINSSNLSLSLFRNMLKNYCKNKETECQKIDLIDILPAID